MAHPLTFPAFLRRIVGVDPALIKTDAEAVNTAIADAGWKGIIKKLADGRQMILGFERVSKRSRKYRTKFLFKVPLILDEIVKKQVLPAAANDQPGSGGDAVQPSLPG